MTRIIRSLFPFFTYRLLLLAEMVGYTADQSQINLDFCPVCMLTMWLLRTSYIATIQYDTVVILLHSECDHENNQALTYV